MPLIPQEWLGSHVELPEDLSPAQLAAALVKVGLEEEAIHPGAVTGPLVFGRVLSREPKKQSNGKIINYCRVDVGQYNDEPGTGREPSELPSRGIICGAHNFEEGDTVVVSLPGAVLPGGFEIAARKTYGHISDGMMCSERELGLSDESEGIIVLDDAAAASVELGSDARQFLGLPGETLEINVTPDRGYCFSMRGVAREYHHSSGARFTDPGLADAPLPEATPTGFPVRVEDNAPIHGQPGCDLFVTRVVRGVDPAAPSPAWMARRLQQAGQRSISLAVDATNYVMLDLGQPLHAYDLDKIRGGGLVVRRAKAGEKLTTLDDVERTLDPEDLLITDNGGERVLGVAGVMGGADTEITAETSNVLIEAAHFDAVSVARSARRHKLPTEASKRFERGVDPAVAAVAAQRVVDLLVEYGGGEATDEVFVYGQVHQLPALAFPVADVERLTSLQLSEDRIAEILTDIGCTVERGGAVWSVQPPTWRPDLVGSAHLVEEIARLEGYDAIPTAVPAAPAGRGLSPAQRQRRDIARTLAETGWVQVLTYPFIPAARFDELGYAADDERRTAIALANPLQDEANLLRTSLLDTLIPVASLNVKRGNPAVAVFEMGTVSRPAGISPAPIPAAGQRPSEDEIAALHAAIPAQPHHVAGVACGPRTAARAGYPVETWDWRDAVEAGRRAAGMLAEVSVRAANQAPWHPGRCAAILSGDRVVGYAGELAPAVCKALDIPARSVAFEVNTDAALPATVEPAAVKPVWTSPVAKEDLAFIVDADVIAGDVRAAIVAAAGEALEGIELFDVFTGDPVPEGKKSLAFALRFRTDHTLTAEETSQVRHRVARRMRKDFGAELRA
ncbi:MULTISPECIES: phenylalanine--tRNA ligase subunit beta [Actinotignum]|uniref:phenylalanine--tRNA ligase subunit beta n=1 Tax=Actinotignum TaxID=1653174 RepID=UPI000B358D2B|nr:MULTISPECIES: phenylalanine--tRNA ligase subunit beta [Actinotignum]MDE1536519.1 phenylalanine--tRNA ligase subunit beta [Actinotignum schaalii]MDK7270780.1 phenylalanine--tRNA ligase subunit beta [Actinotignum schaalii]MDY5143922.1 phenylalanine--tRNA ligase subunit beta [Actinotignum timonense]